MDGQRCSPYINILWHTGYSSSFFPGIHLHYLCGSICHDRQLMDYHRHYRHRTDGNREAQGFSEGWIAGAIISGAYFGDKVSPLSDTTILASSVTDTPLFTHIRYLMITTVPSLVITLIIFTIAGLSHEATDTGHIAEYTRILSDKFHISWWLMIVPVVTAILIARKVPSIITLFVSTALATVFALIFPARTIMRNRRTRSRRDCRLVQRRNGNALWWNPIGNR